MKKQGILFDMDGTLWDSAKEVAESWTIALAQCGYGSHTVTREDMYATMGRTMDQIADALFPYVEGEDRARLLAACCDVENDYLRAHGGQLYPKLRETMERLRALGYHLYIVSNCQAGYIEAFLDYYQLWDLFEDIECFGNNGKSKSENIRLLYERNALDAGVYVGDIQGDYDATTAAGLPFIHASYGFGTIGATVPAIAALLELPQLIPSVLPRKCTVPILLFDMDMTLLDFHRSEHEALSRTLTEIGIAPTQEALDAYSRINLSQWKLLEKGLLTRDVLKIRRFEIFFEEHGINFAAAEAAKIYEGHLAHGFYYLPGAQELLEKLRGQYPMYIVSNGSSHIQHSRIDGAQLAQYFDGIFISEDVGYNKPDSRFFDTCFAQIAEDLGKAFDPADCIIIGDSLTSDIRGGKNVGIRTIWYHVKDEAASAEDRPDYEISDLAELPVLLEQIVCE